MAYRIQCLKCGKNTWAGSIADLIDAYTDNHGRLVCAQCGAREAYVHQITGSWEREPDIAWDEYIKGVLRLGTDSSIFIPYFSLTAHSADGAVSGVRFSYCEAPGPNGRRTDGQRPRGRGEPPSPRVAGRRGSLEGTARDQHNPPLAGSVTQAG